MKPIALNLTLALLFAFSCKSREETAAEVKADLPQRKLLGIPASYTPKPLDAAVLRQSMTARRAHGWSVVRELIKPTSLIAPNTLGAQLPAWLTYYEPKEFRRIFAQAYQDYASRVPPGGGTIDADLWRQAYSSALTAYPRQQDLHSVSYQTMLDVLTHPATSSDVRSALSGGLGRGKTLFNQALVEGYLRNFWSIKQCREQFPPINEQREDTIQRLERQHLLLPEASQDRRDSCFAQPLPPASVAVKAKWEEVNCGPEGRGIVRVNLAKVASQELADAVRQGTFPGRSAPSSARCSDFYHVRVPRVQGTGYSDFILTGLHIMTKEIPDWIWITLWWAPESARALSADRPNLCEGLTPEDCRFLQPWQNYVMAVATDSVEEDPQLARAETQTTEPLKTLAAIASAPPPLGDPPGQRYTWCSNPYIESATGQANSNCIGCHQHASPAVTFDDGGRRHHRRSRWVNHLPADYLWSFREFADGMSVEQTRIDSANDQRAAPSTEPLRQSP